MNNIEIAKLLLESKGYKIIEADVTLSKEDMNDPDKVPSFKAMAQKVSRDEKEAKRKAELKAKAETLIKNIDNEIDNIGSDASPSDVLQIYFDHLVPPSGKADTEAGEIVRAMMRLLYRDYNDGDLFYSGYGYETCAPAASYVADRVNLYDDFEEIAEKGLTGDKYTEALEDITAKVIIYLREHEELLAVTNTSDMFDSPTEWLEDHAYGYEYDLDVPEGCDYRDFVYFVQDIASNFDKAYVDDRFRDYIVIRDLSAEEYDELDHHFYSWVEEWMEENAPEEEYEDEDEE